MDYQRLICIHAPTSSRHMQLTPRHWSLPCVPVACGILHLADWLLVFYYGVMPLWANLLIPCSHAAFLETAVQIVGQDKWPSFWNASSAHCYITTSQHSWQGRLLLAQRGQQNLGMMQTAFLKRKHHNRPHRQKNIDQGFCETRNSRNTCLFLGWKRLKATVL